MTIRRLKSLDLFSGCGGLSLGMSLAGEGLDHEVECLAAIDNWDAACRSFSANLDAHVVCGEVNAAKVASVLDAVGDVDLVTGGPPCQGFSTSGKRALDDPRNSLIRAFLDSVDMAGPRAFLMENVTGFTSFQGGDLMREVIRTASEELGYSVYPGIVLASRAGVPQRRRRFILVGVREGQFLFPNSPPREQIDRLAEADTLFGQGDSGLLVNERNDENVDVVTFEDATSDLPPLGSGERADFYASSPQNAYQSWCRGLGGEELTLHFASKHRPSFVEMMSYIPQGMTAFQVADQMPESLRPNSGFPNSYGRIRADQPSPTITRNFTTPSSANCIHPKENRALSLREGARCQSFPDDFNFVGTHGDVRLQIGNAVPPLLAKSLGVQLLRALGAKPLVVEKAS